MKKKYSREEMENEETVVLTEEAFKEFQEKRKPSFKREVRKIKEVNEYDLEGNYIYTYPNYVEAARILNVKPHVILNCCSGRTALCSSIRKIFLYRDADIEERLLLLDKRKTVSFHQKICEYTLKGRLIMEYDTLKIAARVNKLSSYAISKCCKGEIPYIGKKIFLYAKDSIVDRLPIVNERLIYEKNRRKKCRPVDEYTLDGKFVKAYPSGSEAGRQTNVHYSVVHRCCHGEYLSVGERIFLYTGESIKHRLKLINDK